MSGEHFWIGPLPLFPTGNTRGGGRSVWAGRKYLSVSELSGLVLCECFLTQRLYPSPGRQELANIDGPGAALEGRTRRGTLTTFNATRNKKARVMRACVGRIGWGYPFMAR